MTLAILGFVPILIIAGALEMQILAGQVHAGQEAMEAASKASYFLFCGFIFTK